MRLDQYLVQKQLAESRERGRAYIMEGIVYVNGEKAEKPGVQVQENAQVEVRGTGLAYVSRGGLKLEKAMEVFPASPGGKVCMDIGASTGGFTDCMLQNGAARVYAIDVGYGQLAWKLRCDERVVVMERTNARNLSGEDVPDLIEFFSVDVSFISLKLILPAVARIAAQNCEGVCLVKPQFEAGKGKVGKKGVVREAKVHLQVILDCMGYAADNGFSVKGLSYSPIKGPQGNIEFLMYVRREAEPAVLPESAAEQVCEDAYAELELM